jgi:hypothetical protein
MLIGDPCRISIELQYLFKNVLNFTLFKIPIAPSKSQIGNLSDFRLRMGDGVSYKCGHD